MSHGSGFFKAFLNDNLIALAWYKRGLALAYCSYYESMPKNFLPHYVPQNGAAICRLIARDSQHKP